MYTKESDLYQWKSTSIDDCLEVRAERWTDQRGELLLPFNEAGFKAKGLPIEWRQTQVTNNHKNVLRGLYYSKDGKATRLITSLHGSIFAVCVDLRVKSPTWKRHIGRVLTGEHCKGLLIPQGCAFGFYTLTDAMVHTMSSTVYDPEEEAGLAWNDPTFDIAWPTEMPILSSNDMYWPKYGDVNGG